MTDKRQIEGVHGCDPMIGTGTWRDILSASISPITTAVGIILTVTKVLLQGFFVLIVAGLLTTPVLADSRRKPEPTPVAVALIGGESYMFWAVPYTKWPTP